jgi:hypothetical protein
LPLLERIFPSAASPPLPPKHDNRRVGANFLPFRNAEFRELWAHFLHDQASLLTVSIINSRPFLVAIPSLISRPFLARCDEARRIGRTLAENCWLNWRRRRKDSPEMIYTAAIQAVTTLVLGLFAGTPNILIFLPSNGRESETGPRSEITCYSEINGVG